MLDNFHDWYITCRDWLVPLGFVETYKNHPAKEIREFHWIKDGIRICCVFDLKSGSYCYIYSDILFMEYPFALQGMRYIMGDEKLLEIHKYFQTVRNMLHGTNIDTTNKTESTEGQKVSD